MLMRQPELIERYFVRLFAFQDLQGVVKGLTVAATIVYSYLFKADTEQAAALGLAILLVLDLVTGVAAAIKEGRAVTSRALSQTVVKLVDYFAVIVVAAVVEHTVFGKRDVPVVEGVVYLMIATEGLSILENARRCGFRSFPFLEKILDGINTNANNPAALKSGAEDEEEAKAKIGV